VTCPQCRHPNAPDARFCNACGARLEMSCAACRHANQIGSRFCSGCGQPLTIPEVSTAPAQAPPGSYTPAHLAQRILT